MAVLRNISIISGGQTGADRAALDFALAHGFPHEGWCPRKRRAEDGVIPSKYLLQETPSTHYAQRTEWNVRDSDATLIITIKPRLSGGTRLTAEIAARLGKPVLHLSRDGLAVDVAAGHLSAFIDEQGVSTLNVAGPRASQEPELAVFVELVLRRALVG